MPNSVEEAGSLFVALLKRLNEPRTELLTARLRGRTCQRDQRQNLADSNFIVRYLM